MRRLPRFGALSLLVMFGCGPDRPTLTEEQLELRRELLPELQYIVDGVTYAVSKKPRSPGVFEVSTKGQPGTAEGVFKAVRQAYGCQSISVSQTSPDWRTAEARGVFCKSDY